jgi:hypothetical protein
MRTFSDRPKDGLSTSSLSASDTTASQGLTDPEKNDHRRRKTFDSECRAYEIAAQAAFLRDHIPHSFRRREIADVTEYGESVADDYLLPCCLYGIHRRQVVRLYPSLSGRQRKNGAISDECDAGFRRIPVDGDSRRGP